MERYIKNIRCWFIENSELNKIYDTLKPFPTHLERCQDETWEKVLDHNRYEHKECYNYYFISSTKEEFDKQNNLNYKDENYENENYENLIKLLTQINNV